MIINYIKVLQKNEAALNGIISDEQHEFFSSSRSHLSTKRRIDSSKLINKSINYIRTNKASDNRHSINTISQKTFYNKRKNSSAADESKSSNRIGENEILITGQNNNLTTFNNKNYNTFNKNNDINDNFDKQIDFDFNLDKDTIRNRRNTTAVPRFGQIENNMLGFETGEITKKTLDIPIHSTLASPQKFLSPDYQLNNEEVKEEINELLNIRENEKIKLSQRRKSINIRRKSLYEKKKNLELGSAAIVTMLNKENQVSQQEKYKKYIKYIDILIAITVCVNVAISIIDNELYISNSDAFLKEYTKTNNITSNLFIEAF